MFLEAFTFLLCTCELCQTTFLFFAFPNMIIILVFIIDICFVERKKSDSFIKGFLFPVNENALIVSSAILLFYRSLSIFFSCCENLVMRFRCFCFSIIFLSDEFISYLISNGNQNNLYCVHGNKPGTYVE